LDDTERHISWFSYHRPVLNRLYKNRCLLHTERRRQETYSLQNLRPYLTQPTLNFLFILYLITDYKLVTISEKEMCQ
jgi:hypothetical protein